MTAPNPRLPGVANPKLSGLELSLARQIRFLDLDPPVPEFRFHPTRRWRFDLAYPERMLAIEVEGGTWVHGRHSRGDGMDKDCEKYAEAVLMGWAVIRVTSGMIDSGAAARLVERAMERFPVRDTTQ